ncbi:hypothetical protein BGZ58_002899 [Dissophora ornata]|nr:hypothetical protein BGZ58_002899 [Dissophora ornata]
MSRQPLPTDLVGVLLTQERRRISIQAAKLLETHGQVFRRIVLERQEAWSLALSGMEREQRIDFLVQELKRWATDRQQKRDNHDLEGPLDFYNAGGQAMGLGLGTGISVGIEPSLREALDMSQVNSSGQLVVESIMSWS